MTTKIFLSTSAFARELGVCTRTVERWIAGGRIAPARRTPGGHARFSLEQVDVVKAASAARATGKIAPPDGPKSPAERSRVWLLKLLIKRGLGHRL